MCSSGEKGQRAIKILQALYSHNIVLTTTSET